MSLYSIVQGGLTGSLNLRERLSPRQDRALPVALAGRPSIGSMRLLETGLALAAIATAILIGQGG